MYINIQYKHLVELRSDQDHDQEDEDFDEYDSVRGESDHDENGEVQDEDEEGNESEDGDDECDVGSDGLKDGIVGPGECHDRTACLFASCKSHLLLQCSQMSSLAMDSSGLKTLKG